MFITPQKIEPQGHASLLAAAEAAVRAIPPAFPLEATVAVNPYLGQTGLTLAATGARLARVAGAPVTAPRALHAGMIAAGAITKGDLQAALVACAHPARPASVADLITGAGAPAPMRVPLPTVADLAATASGTDWPAIIAERLGAWAAAYFDRGQALWTPAPGLSAYASWRQWAVHDLTPELAGLPGFAARVAAAPDTPERAIAAATGALGLADGACETAFHRLLMGLGGWAQHARYLLWQAELQGGTDSAASDLLAIRLTWEDALLAAYPGIGGDWAAVAQAHGEPVEPDAAMILDTILQEAAERAAQRRLKGVLDGAVPAQAAAARPGLQAAFCIDVRSEVFRRALEAQGAGIETIGFAGFFGLPLSHRGFASDVAEAHLPVLLSPAMHSHSAAPVAVAADARFAARAARAIGRFRQAAVSSFAFVEAAGPFYAGKLVRDALGLAGKLPGPDAAPALDTALTPAQKQATAAAVLKAMSMTGGFAPLVLILGHGANVTNNPHASALHCGACGGYTGEVSARLLAILLNDPEARAGLGAQGIDLPADTHFLAGLHDTTTDTVTLFPDTPATSHADAIAAARRDLAAAGAMARAERSLRLPGATPDTVAARALNWAETRPEWGLAGCQAFIAAPRAATLGRDLQGRAFLHNYDWQADAGFATLELILTAPVVVASWISLQYYGSALAPETFGGGTKLLHNVVGGIGVVEGNGGTLRAGLPWQSVHDGTAPAHEALRLSVMIEAPTEAIDAILARHAGVRALFDNRWLHLFTLVGGRMAQRYVPKGWETA